MATIEHEALVDLFRRDPALIAKLLVQVFAAALPEFANASVVDTSLVQLVPTEFRADLVIELRDAKETPVLVIVVEPQRGPDPRKRFSWPVYIAAARARSKCPACLVVIAPDRAVARWARRTIDLGLGRGSVSPIVIGPDEVPLIDEEEARENLELAVLSIIVHGEDDAVLPAARGAITALTEIDAPGRRDYLYVIIKSLRDPLLAALRKWIMGKDETTEQYVAKFRPLLGEIADALEAEGRAKGEAEGIAKGIAASILEVFANRRLPLTDVERARIQGCTDVPTLQRWFRLSLNASSVEDALQ